MKKQFILSILAGLFGCADPQFVLVTLTAPSGTVAPEAEVLEVTISGEPDGTGTQKTLSFSLEDNSLPTSFFLEFRPERRGLPIELTISGKQSGVEVFTATGITEVGAEVTLTATFCGDLLTNPANEECDDGNRVDADGCEADCTLPACGNGVVDPGEFCYQDSISLAAGIDPVDIALGDLDENGFLEIGAANAGSDSITLYSNLGDGQFAIQTTPSIGAPQNSIKIADLNPETNIQLLDILVGEVAGNLTVLKQNTSNAFTKQSLAFPTTNDDPTSLCLGDFRVDGQGFLDIAAMNPSTKNYFIRNQSPGTNNGVSLAAPVDLVTNSLSNVDLIEGDFNQDVQGNLDLARLTFLAISASVAKLDVQLLSGNGDGTFVDEVTFTGTTIAASLPPEGPHQLIRGDINSDGRLDLVFLVPGKNQLVFMLGNAQTVFAPAQIFPLDFVAKSLALADLSGDGVLDLLVTNETQLVLFPGLGNAQFGAPLSLAAGASPVAPTVGDLNNDGAPDLIIAEKDAASLRVFFAAP
jgi:cysteine-rich repeat protein